MTLDLGASAVRVHTDNWLLFSTILWWVRRNFPRFSRVRLIIDTPEGRNIFNLDPACETGEPCPCRRECGDFCHAPNRPGELRESEQTILDAIGDEALPLKQIAARSGYALNSHLRALVRQMHRDGHLEKDAEGRYRATRAGEV